MFLKSLKKVSFMTSNCSVSRFFVNSTNLKLKNMFLSLKYFFIRDQSRFSVSYSIILVVFLNTFSTVGFEAYDFLDSFSVSPNLGLYV